MLVTYRYWYFGRYRFFFQSLKLQFSIHIKVGITLCVRATRLFSPNCPYGIHFRKSGGKVKIYRFTLSFWESMADIESEGGLFVNLSKLRLKSKSLLFVQNSNIISTRHNIWILLFQTKWNDLNPICSPMSWFLRTSSPTTSCGLI